MFGRTKLCIYNSEEIKDSIAFIKYIKTFNLTQIKHKINRQRLKFTVFDIAYYYIVRTVEKKLHRKQ